MTQTATLNVCGEEIEYDPTKEYGMWSGDGYGRILDLKEFQRKLTKIGERKEIISQIEKQIELQGDLTSLKRVETNSLATLVYASDKGQVERNREKLPVLEKNISNTIELIQRILNALV